MFLGGVVGARMRRKKSSLILYRSLIGIKMGFLIFVKEFKYRNGEADTRIEKMGIYFEQDRKSFLNSSFSDRSSSPNWYIISEERKLVY